MHELLKVDFVPQKILTKRKSIKKEILSEDRQRTKKRIAILGGSSTHDIKEILELFLLDNDIEPSFYQSEYGLFFEDAVFSNEELNEFKPDFVLVHTSWRNIKNFPTLSDNADSVDELLGQEFQKFKLIWEKLFERFNCVIIQNNFEMPFERFLGNKDCSDIHGKINFLTRLNQKFYEYSSLNSNFYINDINYISAVFGLENYSDPLYWYMYKYSLSLNAVPSFCKNVSDIVKSTLGKNKKALVVDLDNTLWGGVVGDDGVEGLKIGSETSTGQAFYDFQSYVKSLKQLGVMLLVNSKNELNNALDGLNHPEGVLRPEDFIEIAANWQSKDVNILELAEKLNIGVDSIVFADDNPAEREIVAVGANGVEAPDIKKVYNYINEISKRGYFETTVLSSDDANRNEMYQANTKREQQRSLFSNYSEYLKSLEMKAVVKPFDDIYIARIAQLTNKTNQFNLTTKRYTEAEIKEFSSDSKNICLYGKLTDKFGDNGVVSVVVGQKADDVLNIDLWLMSCRVIKRNMEHAMLDALCEKAKQNGVKKIIGRYFKTEKNAMVKDFYSQMGFMVLEQDEQKGVFELDLERYKNKNNVIEILD